MLPKKEKFTTTDFSLIKKLKPRKTFTNIGVFCIYQTFTPTQTVPKFTFVPTKKIFKTAVQRNKHKRYFYSSCQELKPLTQEICLIFYPSKFFTKAEIKNELRKILK